MQLLLACLVAAMGTARAQTSPDFEAPRVSPYADTPDRIVVEMLKLAQVGPTDYVIDLGSGDGRLVIVAVKDFGARGGLGVDIDEKLVAYANASAAQAGLADRVKFERRDLFDTDVSAASVVTIYLLPGVLGRVRDKLLAEAKPGTRVVSHDYPLPGWTADRIATFAAPEKEITVAKRDAVVFLYTVPPRQGVAPR